MGRDVARTMVELVVLKLEFIKETGVLYRRAFRGALGALACRLGEKLRRERCWRLQIDMWLRGFGLSKKNGW